jgi:hypothetical protein
MRVLKRFFSTVSALLLSFPLLLSPITVFAQGELIVCGPNQDLKCTLSDKECSKQSDCVANSNLPDALGGSACQNGYCYFDPIRMNEYERSTTTIFGVEVQNEIVELKKPALEINIPGLNFSDSKQTLDKDGYIHVPYLGEFLSALYNYALVIGSIIAVLMIIKSGVTIILSAGGEGKMEGYHQIGQVVIGLMIMWGSYFVLNTINPKLTKFQALRIKYIEPVNLVSIDPAVYTKVTNEPVYEKDELVRKAIAAGVKVGFADKCLMKTILAQESGARANVIGHDENYRQEGAVSARKNFLMSGITFLKDTFSPPVSNISDYKYAKHNSTNQQNDDSFTDVAPDYGLDWRYSHGLGLGQITLFVNSFCEGTTRGRSVGGTCFTIPDLLTADKNLEFTATLFKEGYDCAGNAGHSGTAQIEGAFLAYNAGCKKVRNSTAEEISANLYVQQAMKKYNSCVGDPDNSTVSNPTEVLPKEPEEN